MGQVLERLEAIQSSGVLCTKKAGGGGMGGGDGGGCCTVM